MVDSWSNPWLNADLAAQNGENPDETSDIAAVASANGRARTFEIRIELPSGLFNEYSYDEKRQTLRLQSVIRPNYALPGDCGMLVGTLSRDGHPLAALLLVSQPIIPGCLVDARLLGGVELPSGEVRIVAVPDVDTAFGNISGYQDLEAEQLQAIERFTIESRDGALHRTGGLRWLSPEEAVEVVREAQRAARLAAAANRKVGGVPAWQVVDPALRAAWLGGATRPHSEAEFSVQDLPFRFQEHVADCLQSEERILHFVHRQRMAVDSRFSLLRRRELTEGLLVATDRQVLLVSDALPPDSTMVDWGYLAIAAPVERLQGVRLDETGPTLRIEIEVQAGRDSDILSMEFAKSSLEACRYVASILRRFIPKAETRSLRRLYEVKAADIDLSWAAELAGAEAVSRLEALSGQTVPDGEEVLARALAPAMGDRGRGSCLLVATSKRVLLLEDRNGKPVVAASLDVEAIGSAELRYSILGSRLRLNAHTVGGRQQLILDSENPSVFGPMLQTFRVLLPLLANPA